MAVDVVVVNYHTDDLLNQFVESYKAARFADCTLTVVDVESNKYAVLGTWDTYLCCEQNCGYGRACNEGAKGGENDVILLANADTVLSDGFKECYDALVSREDWAVLGPRQVNAQNQITAGGIVGPITHQRAWLEHDLGQVSFVDENVHSASGSLYFIKRAVWDELAACPLGPGANGAFLETPHFFEETFCSFHARAHGYKCVYYGPVKMIHYWQQSPAPQQWVQHQFNASAVMHRAACAKHGIDPMV